MLGITTCGGAEPLGTNQHSNETPKCTLAQSQDMTDDEASGGSGDDTQKSDSEKDEDLASELYGVPADDGEDNTPSVTKTDSESEGDDLASELYGVPSGGDGDSNTGSGNATPDTEEDVSLPNEPAGMDKKTAPGTTDTSGSPEADSGEVGESSGSTGGIPFNGPPMEGADGGPGGSLPADAPISDEEAPPEPESGVFYVKHAEDAAATLHEVNTSQIYTVLQHPDLQRHEIVEATLIAVPPMEVSYTIDEINSRREILVEQSPEQPTQQVLDIAADLDEGEAIAIEREGKGEIHILRVKPEWTGRTADELHDDEMTYKNVARYGVERVEIRTDEDDGIVAIRYLP